MPMELINLVLSGFKPVFRKIHVFVYASLCMALMAGCVSLPPPGPTNEAGAAFIEIIRDTIRKETFDSPTNLKDRTPYLMAYLENCGDVEACIIGAGFREFTPTPGSESYAEDLRWNDAIEFRGFSRRVRRSAGPLGGLDHPWRATIIWVIEAKEGPPHLKLHVMQIEPAYP